ncbi:selenocysteine lyase [Candidatus Parcubacteria bacterium]|nr:MAG: selenocysteine lyase [Candidatus Parcubacteria bacterium]
MNIKKLRKDFYFLQKKNYIYFDNACNSLRPDCVVEKINEYYKEYPVCAGRSNYALAEKLTTDLLGVRKNIAKFISAKEDEIIFTKNTTESINLLANSLDLKEGDIVLTTDKEHNSNLIPWIKLKSKGVIHKTINSNPDNTFNIERLSKVLCPEVKLLALGMSSNLDGVSIPAKEIIDLAHKNGSLVLLDAAQSAISEKIDVKYLDVDFLAFSGHKILGPSGTGVLFGKKDLLEKLGSFLVGGSTVHSSSYDDFELADIPERFEAGLQNFSGILGLGEAIKYLEKIGLKNIQKQKLVLNEYLSNELLKIDKLHIIGPEEASRRSGIVSFYIDDIDSHQLSIMLDRSAGIMTRSGQHCVHSWFKSREVASSLRVSMSFYNTLDEVKKFVDELNNIIKILR